MNRNFARRAAALFLLGAAASLTACGHLGIKQPSHPITDVLKVVPEQGYKPDPRYGTLSLETNAHVQEWINYFTGRGRPYMHLYLERSARYMPLMKATFRERGMPENLAYIAMIESGLNANAFSYASAVGYWQFIRSTGQRYNLRIDRYVDERRDPILSTEAAATYLDSLYSIFGDWYLALAAYNTGEGRVMHAVMRYHTRNFWKLCRYRWSLPLQTKNYVPKFIAAVLIATHPTEYGFNDIDEQPAFTFDSVVIHKPISLQKLATELHVDYDELKLMNPRYKSDYVPVYADRINAIRVPVGMKQLALADISGAYSTGPKHYIESFEYYRIRPGDNLGFIAARFHTSVPRLRYLNDLSRRTTFIRAGHLIRVPEFGRQGWHHQGVQHRRTIASTQSRGYRYYRIRPGDNLGLIAARFHTSIRELRQLNRLGPRTFIRAGRLLRVSKSSVQRGHNQAAHRGVTHHSTAVASVKGRYRYYRIRPGDNLIVIAKRFHTSVIALLRLNHLYRHSMIRAGQLLRVGVVASASHHPAMQRPNSNQAEMRRLAAHRPVRRLASAKKKVGVVHIVRRGENLTTIAHRYHVSISKLTRINAIHRHTVLLAGTELIIPD